VQRAGANGKVMQAAAVAAMVLPGAGRIEKAMPAALTAHWYSGERPLPLPPGQGSISCAAFERHKWKNRLDGDGFEKPTAGKPSQSLGLALMVNDLG